MNMEKMFFLQIFCAYLAILAVPPKVSPFYTEDTLHVGDRASLTCSVTKGDLPLTISWHKDGRSVEPAQLVSITQVDQFTSILLIESLSQEHNGNYSCVVRNLAAEVQHTQHLMVNGNSLKMPVLRSVPFGAAVLSAPFFSCVSHTFCIFFCLSLSSSYH